MDDLERINFTNHIHQDLKQVYEKSEQGDIERNDIRRGKETEKELDPYKSFGMEQHKRLLRTTEE